jgi:autotransporter-associated beta strand protein
MFRRLYPVVITALGIGLALVSPARAQLPPGGPWALRFADEFDDTYAGNIMGLDPDKWSPAYPWTRVHNYPAYIRDENILVNTNNNGLLQLWGKRENFGGQPFTSGAINSNGHFNFGLVGKAGYMEARMKMPNFLGAWPAFWSLQEGWPPEIDVMEFVRNGAGSPNTSPNNYVANVHFRNSAGQNASSWSGFRDAGAGDLTAGFHNYGFRWNDNTLTWYIDGRQFHSYTGPDAIAQMQRMYLILNLGIGGWPGDPPAGENVNKSFDVDWVRVWQAPDAPRSTYVGPGGYQNWDDNSKWSNGAPKLASTTAVFGPLASGTAATLDWVDTKTVRGLDFSTPASYRIGFEDDLLVFSNWDTTTATPADANVGVATHPGSLVNGTHTIASRVELHSNTRVVNHTANTLTFLGDVHGGGSLTFQHGRTRFDGSVSHRGGTTLIGGADATFSKRLGTSSAPIHVGTAAFSVSTLRLLPSVTTVDASHLRIGDAGGTGSLIQSGGAVTVTGGEVWVGQGAGSTGNYTHNGGSLALANWLAIGREGAAGTYRLGGNAVLTKSGPGNVIIGSLGGTGTFIQTGGTVNVLSSNTLLGEDAGGAGTYTITAGNANLRDVVLSQRGAGSGTFNLDGGTVTAARVRRAGTGAATFNFNGGTLRASDGNTAFMQGLTAANIKAAGARIDTNGFNVTIAQPLLDGGGGGLTKSGAGTLTLASRNTYAGPTTVSAGRLVFGASQQLSSLTIQPGAAAGIAPGTPSTVVTGSFDIGEAQGNWAGVLNVGSGALAIDYDGGASPLSVVADQVRSAARGGWTGQGITSTAADENHVGVGYGESALLLGPDGGSFGGEGVDGTAVLVRATPYGDANLDGLVSSADLLTVRRNLGARGSRGVWQNGDFDYDGTVGVRDLALLRRNFGARMPAAVAGDYMVVPEPQAVAALLPLYVFGLRRRRRA